MRYSIFTLIGFIVVLCQQVQAGPLHDAARTGDIAAVTRLLDQGVKIDEGDGEYKTALYHAVANNRPDIVQLLIDRDADANGIRKGLQGPVDAPIHVAAKKGLMRIIEILAAAGADLTKATVYGQAPLHLALHYKKTQAAELLRSLGAGEFAAPSVNALIADADVELGGKLAKGCNKCHALQEGGKPLGGYGSLFGPTLWNIIGRKKAGIPGWEYSTALSNFKGEWTYEDLNNFITNPTATVPGTKMLSFIESVKARAAILAYLRTLSDNPAPLP
jgi:cytochrome c